MSALKMQQAARMMRDTAEDCGGLGGGWSPEVARAAADLLEKLSRGSCCDDCLVDPGADPFRAAGFDLASAFLRGVSR